MSSPTSPASVRIEEREVESPATLSNVGITIRTATRIAWISEVTVDILRCAFSDGTKESMEHWSRGFEWQGLEWGLLLSVDQDELDVYIYVRRPPGSVVRSFAKSVSAKFYLMDHMNHCRTAKSKPYLLRILFIPFLGDLILRFKLDVHSQHMDHGRQNYFGISFRQLCRDDRYLYHTSSSNIRSFRIGVRIENVPEATVVSTSYNSKVSTGMVGLSNLGATCYLNALLQMLFHIPAFRRLIYSFSTSNDEKSVSNNLIFELQTLFYHLQHSNVEVSTENLTKAFGWSTNDSFLQQDVQEMMRLLLDKLEEIMKGTSFDGSISRLFQGKLKSFIRCLHIQYESCMEEDFYDIQLDVKGCPDIHASFKQYIARELLSEENQYDAGEDRGKQDAEKGVDFASLPPVLTIHLKRFHFDIERLVIAPSIL